MPSQAHRLLTVLLLLGWMCPGVAAMGVSLHLVVDHNHPQAAEEPVGEWALAAVHGHHHPDPAPEHQHEAALDAVGPTLHLPLGSAGHAASSPALLPICFVRSGRVEHPPRGAPPTPLFTAHCSLLL